MSDLLSNINDMYDANLESYTINLLQKLVGTEQFRPKLDLITNLLKDDVDLIELSCKRLVVIAGTNGKGETAHDLRYLLNKEGYTTALWTSPHVLTICERIMFNELPITYERLCALISLHSNTAIEHKLSFYEYLFYIFVKAVVEKNLDFIILEVGLGGRFDAVNMFKNPVTAITSISRDHTNILGNKLQSILFEKYGVTRSGGVLFSGIEQEHLNEIIEEWCKRDHIKLRNIGISSKDYSKRNQEMAKQLCLHMGISVNENTLMWPVSKGRREKVTFLSRNFIFIGAHNLDGHRKMLKMLEDSEKMNRENDILLLSFSTGREDQIDSMISLYEKSYPCLFGEKFITGFSSERCVSEDTLLNIVNDEFSHLKDWNLVFNDSYKNKNIYVIGSYFFISDFQLFIRSYA